MSHAERRAKVKKMLGKDAEDRETTPDTVKVRKNYTTVTESKERREGRK